MAINQADHPGFGGKNLGNMKSQPTQDPSDGSNNNLSDTANTDRRPWATKTVPNSAAWIVPSANSKQSADTDDRYDDDEDMDKSDEDMEEADDGENDVDDAAENDADDEEGYDMKDVDESDEEEAVDGISPLAVYCPVANHHHSRNGST
jgi:hypothetical protein